MSKMVKTIKETLQVLDCLKETEKDFGGRYTWEYYDAMTDASKQFDNYPFAITYNGKQHTYEKKDDDFWAIRYCERYGIVEAHVSNGSLIYYASYPGEGATYKCVVDLKTYHETRTEMKRYYKPYQGLIGGRYQANWG